MKFLFTICFLFISATLTAQNFEDDFSDGDFTNNPTWSGADSNFVIFDLDGNNVLRLSDNEAGSSYLSTPSTNAVGEWEFFVRIDGNAPSNGNKAEIVLMSDIADLSGGANGYAVRIGQTGDDVFKIVRLDAGAQTTVLEDTTIFDSGGSYRIKVTRDVSGNWEIEVGEGYNGELKNSGNTANDNTYTNSSFFGVLVTYSSTRVDDFYFDFKIDPPPVIIDPLFVDLLFRFSGTEIDLSFSRDIDFASVATTDFELNGSINPQSFSNQGSNALRITFTDVIPGGENQLTVSGIESSVNDTVLTDTTITFFIYDEYEAGDIIINEFLKDPPPGTDLPEYVELRNTSSKYLNLKDWEIGDNNSLATISEDDLVILPDSFLVLTSEPDALTSTFGAGEYAEVSLPALNNTTDQIRIFDGSALLIDSLEYTPEWGGVDVSLERRTQDAASTLQANWGDSPDAIGTPGRTNDIEPDTTPPDIESYEFLNDSTLRIIFTEAIIQAPAEITTNYELITSSGNDFSTPGIESVNLVEPDTVVIAFTFAFQGDGDGENYSFSIGNQQDFFGNVAGELNFDFEFREFDTALEGEVAINEFMYDPAETYSEFVELFNHTNKTFNLQNWTFNDNSGNRRTLTFETYALSSGQFVLLAPDSTIVENFPGTPLLRVSGFPALNNSTDDLVLRNAEGSLIDSLTYSSDWGGDEVSLERRSADFTGTLQANWGDSPSANFGTPGTANEIEPDTTAPEVESFEFLNDSTLQIIFTESVAQVPAETIANYELAARLDNQLLGPEIAQVDFVYPDTVIVLFSFSFEGDGDGENFTFYIQNQEDIFGNSTEQLSFGFEFREFETALENEVVINEFMYDPTDDYSEFVELFNHTDKTFNLRNWTFNDNSGNIKIITTGSYFLAPNSYVVLAIDSTIVQSFPGTALLRVSGFPALNNSTDDLVLRNADGNLIDSLTYSSSWGGEEVSLERRSVEVSGIYQANWGDSPSENFGTPGKINEVEGDETAPFVINSFVVSSSSIGILFDTLPIEPAVSNADNYILDPEVEISQISTVSDTVIIDVVDAFIDGQTIDITILNQQDIFGNTRASQTTTVTYFEVLPASSNEVVINEILYRREDELSPEFVELFNQTNKNFDLSGWELIDAGNNNAEIPEGIFLPAGEYLVLTDREDFANTLSNAIYLSDFPSLNDSGDEVIIKNEEGITIDSLFYESSWGGDSPGISLERKDPGRASNDASNWSASTAQGGFSAGVQSSVFEEDVTPPEIIFATQIDSVVQIVFSEFVRTSAQTVINVNGIDVELLELNDNQVIVEWTPAPVAVPKSTSAANIDVTVTDILDIKGNVASEISSPIASPASKGDIIINEIMYDPLADQEDNLPDQTEYIELYNRSNSAVSLEGIFLHDAPDEENEFQSIEPVSSQYKWIQSGGYFLIYSEDEAPTFSESKTAEYFGLEGDSDQFTMRADRSSLSLASSDDAIYLADSTGATIDSVFFDETWQNPNIFDTDGIALERINPLGESNDESNWSSSTHVSGGTPNFRNTIFQEPGAPPESVGITFSPNPFSPDDDGFEDNLFINYTLDAPDYLLRVRIFDRYGRQVRELANNQQAGFTGSLTWDGLTDDRKKNRVGIYIVLFEAYNSASGSDRTFKETVVLARMF